MRRKILILFGIILGLELAYARTLTQHQTWTSSSSSSEPQNQISTRQLVETMPNTETIEVGGSNLSEAELIKEASDAGMDISAVQRLLRTRSPLIITEKDRSITYKLTPNGGIARITETVPQIQNSNFALRSHFEIPADTATTTTINEPPPPSPPQTTTQRKVEGDWEWASTVPKTNTRTYTISPTNSFDTSFDDFFKRHRPQSGGGGVDNVNTNFGNTNWFKHDFPKFEPPAGVTPKVETKTEIDDQGRTITTTKTTYSNVPGGQWPDFKIPSLFDDDHSWRTHFDSFPVHRQSGDVLPDGRKPTTTTTTTTNTINHGFPSIFNSRPKPETTLTDFDEFWNTPVTRTTTTEVPTTSHSTTIQNRFSTDDEQFSIGTLPSFDEWRATHRSLIPSTSTTTTTTPRTTPRVTIELRPEPTKPNQSVDDYLKSLYGSNTTIYTYDLKNIKNNTPDQNTINIDNLGDPTNTERTRVVNEIKPLIDDMWLRDLTKTDSNNYNLNAAAAPTQSGTKISTLTKSFTSSAQPRLSDLDTEMQTVLLRAGITDDDLRNSNGQSITKSRITPDGRRIQTTYRIHSVPETTNTYATQSIEQPTSTFSVNQHFDVQKPSVSVV